jgi:hypothetical protein
MIRVPLPCRPTMVPKWAWMLAQEFRRDGF